MPALTLVAGGVQALSMRLPKAPCPSFSLRVIYLNGCRDPSYHCYTAYTVPNAGYRPAEPLSLSRHHQVPGSHLTFAECSQPALAEYLEIASPPCQVRLAVP